MTYPPPRTPSAISDDLDPRPDLLAAQQHLTDVQRLASGAGDVDWAGAAADGYRDDLADLLARTRRTGTLLDDATTASSRFFLTLEAAVVEARHRS